MEIFRFHFYLLYLAGVFSTVNRNNCDKITVLSFFRFILCFLGLFTCLIVPLLFEIVEFSKGFIHLMISGFAFASISTLLCVLVWLLISRSKLFQIINQIEIVIQQSKQKRSSENRIKLRIPIHRIK